MRLDSRLRGNDGEPTSAPRNFWMENKKILVTGSSGLIGSESVRFFAALGYEVYGIDNDMRAYFFGEDASTDWNRKLLEEQVGRYHHLNLDIRDIDAIFNLFEGNKFELVIHTAAQPSHDWAAREPLTDFSINATGTSILLEATRKFCPEAVFIFTSTNKVYGDTPNSLPLIELETRWEIDPTHPFVKGIDETMSLDDSQHSIFGASKVAADILVQEYGKYFGMRTGTFRGGCLTGPAHSGTQLHGFLAYLIKCIAEGRPYSIFGYKGKQVRDNIHSSDLISAFYEFFLNPRAGVAYNMGGSRFSNISMMEAIEKTESVFNRKGNIEYTDENRLGDHIWYISDVSKFKNHYPKWEYRFGIDDIIQEISEKGHFVRPEVSSLVLSEYGVSKEPSLFMSSHTTENLGPVQSLKSYLLKHVSAFISVEHPFSYDERSASRFDRTRGSLPSERLFRGMFKFGYLTYLHQLFLTFWWFLRRGHSVRVFIGVDALNGTFGVILKKFGFNLKVIYYALGYGKPRFTNPIVDFFYHGLTHYAARGADRVWCLSEPIKTELMSSNEPGSAREKYFLVPAGVNKIIDASVDRSAQNLLIIDDLRNENGIQMAIKTMPILLEQFAALKLTIIGQGILKEALVKLIESLDLADTVTLISNPSPPERERILSVSGIGLCLHRGREGSYVSYDDPSGVKEMIGAGIPVVISNHLPFAEIVREKEMGEVISYQSDELIKAITELTNYAYHHATCSRHARDYASTIMSTNLYDSALKNLEDAPKELDDMHVVVATHEYFKGSGQELRDYIISRKIKQLSYIAHPFSYAKEDRSYQNVYEKGVLISHLRSLATPKKEFVCYLRDSLYNLFFLMRAKHIDVFVGIDSFNALFGILFKKLGKIDTVAFFTIDYVMHNRFGNQFLDRFYVWMDRTAFFNSDYTWNVSGRMSKQRVKELGEGALRKHQIVVPIGIVTEAESIKVKKKPNTIVYSGSLLPEFGLEIMIEALPDLVAKFPDLELRIIGEGKLKDDLIKKAKELKVEKWINWVGFVNTTTERSRWLKLVKESIIGLAPYEDNATTYKRFSDVTKPKDYMSCGLPIVTTKVIPLSEDVRRFNLGRVVEYEVPSFVEGVTELLEGEAERKQIEENVKAFCKTMTPSIIFDKAFSEMRVQ
ncbi:hypothetical protein A3A70_00665 [candidate division WWE3 bacterium RIFCSPLOWO2_01_FULL_42_11]|uniref:NAD-dependent epimerase/dehydratase domain-containing protein n=1 Tax=candidate division WWE3 bacterium RIFCSPLOWO2_01_FULL_42_11 TaxID=1802627 RepID=A0A1F4VRP4_UNCKA|nr:MAG: hypothetical protein A3A70_00665 [candidate division WWE3 bacterium RIFCSPLOWO2_01_FULL_42_11]